LTTSALSASALDILEEPLDLKRDLRQFVGDNPDLGPQEVAARLARYLWGIWESQLLPHGVTQEDFRSVCKGAEREAWLWVFGDRVWEQLASAIAGRVVRRIPESD
jgi:hypothetical protein